MNYHLIGVMGYLARIYLRWWLHLTMSGYLIWISSIISSRHIAALSLSRPGCRDTTCNCLALADFLIDFIACKLIDSFDGDCLVVVAMVGRIGLLVYLYIHCWYIISKWYLFRFFVFLFCYFRCWVELGRLNGL